MQDTNYNKSTNKNKKLKSKILKIGGLALVILILMSTILNAIMIKIEDSKYKPPGKLIEIDGHEMHIYSEGQGYPNVVMTCGSGTPSAYTDYSLIQPEISKVARVSIYERPGYGWSTEANTPRSTEQIVDDLKKLLTKAGENPPYLFVAHSMGAMEVLLYAYKYPEEVEGIVLIDGTSSYKHLNYPEASIPKVGVKLIRGLNHTGILRGATELNLIPYFNERVQYISKDKRKIEKAMIYKKFLNEMVIKEGGLVGISAKSMEKELNLKDIPMVIITADESLKSFPGWEKSQESLLKLSTDSKQIIIKNSNHISINLANSDEIVDIIEELLNKVKINKKGD